MKQAAEIAFVQLKYRTLQSIIYPPEKNYSLEQAVFGTREVLIVCCLPTPFIHSQGINQGCQKVLK